MKFNMDYRRIIVRMIVLLFSVWLVSPPSGCLAQGTTGQTATLPSALMEPTHMVVLEEPAGVISYRHRSGATEIDLVGTKRIPEATGKLKVESKAGYLEIDINNANIKGLPSASRWGKDYLTYVFWVVTPEGEALNMGEILFSPSAAGETAGLNVSTTAQTFWMMITAEPHFAVAEPSPLVVMYSRDQAESTTSNKGLKVEARPIFYTNYYNAYSAGPRDPQATGNLPSELLQARKAIQLAENAGILKYPTPAGQEPLEDEMRTRSTLEQAREFLRRAEVAASSERNQLTRETIQFARTAAQSAESARALAVGSVGQVYIRQLLRQQQRIDKARQALEKQREELSAANAGLLRDIADAQQKMEKSRQELQQLQAGLQKQLKENESVTEQLRLQLQESTARNTQLIQEMEKLRTETTGLRVERDKLCSELRRQLESLGKLNEEGSNIVLTLASDILFDFDKFDLRGSAREQLAKLAMIQLLLFRDVPVKYEGHTDWVGEEDYNQWLSEQRALSVAAYLLQQRLDLYKDDPQRAVTQERLETVQRLLKIDFPRARGGDAQNRKSMLDSISQSVEGKGYRQLAVNEKGKNERNRRVVVVFTKPSGQELTSLCQTTNP